MYKLMNNFYIIYFSSGSVIVHFVIHFHRDVHITWKIKVRLADILQEGLIGSPFVIDTHSFQLAPVGKYKLCIRFTNHHENMLI